MLTLLHSEQPKLYGVLANLGAIGLKCGRGDDYHISVTLTVRSSFELICKYLHVFDCQ